MRLRASLFVSVATLLPLALPLAWIASRTHPPSNLPAAAWVSYLAIALAFLAVDHWYGITLTPDEAVIHSLGNTRIRWANVQGITQESYAGVRRIIVWTDDGRRVRLRAPVMPFPRIGRRKFDEAFHTIGRWWLAHRGPAWEPIRRS